MFLVLWVFEVKPGCEQRFERVYGPGGDWDSLFRRDPDHARTALLRDTMKPRVYWTADYWKSRKSYEEFLPSQAPNTDLWTPWRTNGRRTRGTSDRTKASRLNQARAHSETKPSAPRSGRRNLFGAPATRNIASAAR